MVFDTSHRDDENERPNLDERYISATTASDLSMDYDRMGAVDHLIAAGLVGNRMGAALIHLVGEWGAAAKPPKWTPAEVQARADALPARNGKPDLKRARGDLIVARARALRQAYRTLPGRSDALAIMLEWATMRRVDPDLLSPALYHFLAPTCPVCDGHGKLRMEDAPVLGKQCQHCQGAGTWPQPAGANRVSDWLKACAGKAKAQRAGLLFREHEITPMAERLRRSLDGDDEPAEAQRIAEVFRASMERKRK
jgi:hypothetical protein